MYDPINSEHVKRITALQYGNGPTELSSVVLRMLRIMVIHPKKSISFFFFLMIPPPPRFSPFPYPTLFRSQTFGGRHLGKGSGLSSDLVMSTLSGRDGSLWVGTFDGGLNRVYQGQTTVYNTSNGLRR